MRGRPKGDHEETLLDEPEHQGGGEVRCRLSVVI
jgi:hypothetical protein